MDCSQVEPKVQKLYDYIRERGTILPINDYNEDLLSQDDVHKRVIESIRSGKLPCLPCSIPLTAATKENWMSLASSRLCQ